MRAQGFEPATVSLKVSMISTTPSSRKSIIFLSMTESVIYFTIYGKLMLSRKLKIRRNNFLVDLDWEKIKLTSQETWATQID